METVKKYAPHAACAVGGVVVGMAFATTATGIGLIMKVRGFFAPKA